MFVLKFVFRSLEEITVNVIKMRKVHISKKVRKKTEVHVWN